ncbi:hypothetical protein VmeM32_00075 [Vibrio phage vB_VmeM-32]|nr:hypothetical protein VmeM32_00075 [Vibrio phage vB_VmeM-32]
MSKTAKIRVCATCEWIFDSTISNQCEMCHNSVGSYGARWVYGKNYLTLYKNQTPWREKQLAKSMFRIDQEISAKNDFAKRPKLSRVCVGEMETTKSLSFASFESNDKDCRKYY